MAAAKNVRRFVDGRLVYYRQAADAAFWDDVWQQNDNSRLYRKAKQGKLGFLEKPFRKWLPREGKIIEAGCGRAQHVIALRSRDWDVDGVDFARATINQVLSQFPDLPVRAGDVTQLNVPDNYYSGYISLGVVEHRKEGPEPFLTEAYRVLQPGGRALISVPYLHPLRRLKARWGMYDAAPEGIEFYQYAFSGSEFRQLVESAGFRVLDSIPYDGFKGLKDELPKWVTVCLRIVRETPLLGWPFKKWVKNCRFGHMLMLICEKPADTMSVDRAA